MEDFYKILGVAESASQDEIKATYKKLAKQFHPDLNPGNKSAEERFKKINEAYDTLKAPDRRAAYNQQRSGAFNFRTGHYDPFARAAGPNFGDDIFHRHGMTLDEILREMERNGGGNFHFHHRPRNTDINVTYQITLEEAFSGKEAEITYSAAGQASQKFKIQIPPGIDDGTRVRFPGKGGSSINSAPPGDLFVTIRVTPHYRFVRYGVDLATSVQIDYLDAMLGAEITMPCIDGSTISVKVPKGIQPGQSMRAAGKGMQTRGGQRGDLLIEVIIKNPTLTPEQLELIKQAKQMSQS